MMIDYESARIMEARRVISTLEKRGSVIVEAEKPKDGRFGGNADICRWPVYFDDYNLRRRGRKGSVGGEG